MKIKVLASGSAGNCTAIYSDKQIILIDCGKSITWVLGELGYKLPDSILVTHEHGDHSAAVKSFLQRGVDIYMTQGTFEALNLHPRHNLHIIPAGAEFVIGGVRVLAIPSIHDAAEPVNFILQDHTDRILHVTDTGEVPKVSGYFTKIIIEANYFEERILIDLDAAPYKQRVLENHLSIEQAITFLQKHRAEEVHLIHISKRHGNRKKFLERVAGETDALSIFAD